MIDLNRNPIYYKRLWPFIEEFLSSCIIAILFVAVFLYKGDIVIRWTSLSVMLAAAIIIRLAVFSFTFIPFGAMTVLDILSNSFIVIQVEFIEQFPFRASWLIDKEVRNPDGKIVKSETTYYKVQAKNADGIWTFTAPTYFELRPNVKYQFIIGKHSTALVDVIEL